MKLEVNKIGKLQELRRIVLLVGRKVFSAWKGSLPWTRQETSTEKLSKHCTKSQKKRKIKRDVAYDHMSSKEKTWYRLSNVAKPMLTIHTRARDDGPPGERCYLEYIISDKKNYKDVNWDTTERLT